MISARSLRDPSPSTAALVRFAAFLVAIVSAIVIPWCFASAATGHASPSSAFAIAGFAAVMTLVAVLAARRLDPLRR